MSLALPRRAFFTHSLGIASAMAASIGEVQRLKGTRIRIGVNAYSFNRPLTTGKMTLDDVIDFCAKHNVDGLDATGYYFPGYPKAPADEYIYRLKRKAYLNGVTIAGTGVRNDFTLPDAARRKGEIQLVKDWIEVARKMGASIVRVFSGKSIPEGYTFDQVLEWMVPCFRECAEYGRQHGVLVGLQHHDDFLKTAAQTIKVVDAVGSEWFSVILDVGSVRQGDPYAEIEKLVPYAATWQIKEQVWRGEKAEPIDLDRVRAIIEKVGYRGFTPIEALGQGDPEEIVSRFLERVRQAFVKKA
jgi:sugar phosphate isomerase/epimerase